MPRRSGIYGVKLRPGELNGYAIDLPESVRHEAILRTFHKDGYSTTVKRLSVIRIRNEHHEHAHRVLTQDLRWFESEYREKAEEAARERRSEGRSGTRHHPKTIYR